MWSYVNACPEITAVDLPQINDAVCTDASHRCGVTPMPRHPHLGVLVTVDAGQTLIAKVLVQDGLHARLGKRSLEDFWMGRDAQLHHRDGSVERVGEVLVAHHVDPLYEVLALVRAPRPALGEEVCDAIQQRGGHWLALGRIFQSG